VKTLNLLFLATLLFCFTGCEDKKTEPVIEVNQTNVPHEDQNDTIKIRKINQPYTFLLSDSQDTNHTLHIVNKDINISGVSKKLIILNLFATWCPPCKGEIPYLADLQTKYKDALFIAGILLNDDINQTALQTFKQTYGVNYFISNAKENDALAKLAVERLQLPEDFPIPITILFKDGHYYSHYEGAVPVEMLEHDIKNAINKE